jgi:hypothetical protein
MSGMRNRNLIYAGKLAIVVLVSSTLPRDGFKPAVFIPVGFFFDISKCIKKKPAIDNDAGFPCLLAPQLMGLDL